MTAYFQLALRQGADRVVLIGSDSPSLPRSYLVSAIAQLVDHDVVLGRSHDGGYYLVGMSGRHTEIFRGIDWSTDRVWEQTLARTRHCRLRVAELPEFFDVDEFSDLHRLSTELQRHVQDPAAGRRDVQAFAELLAVVQPLVDRAAADTQRERAAE